LKIDLTTGVLTPLLRGSVIITATSAADTTKSASVTIKVVDRLFTSQAEPLPWLPGLNGMLLFYLETDGSDSAELLTTRECWDPAVSPDHKHVACGTFVIPTDSVQFQSTELIVVTTDGTAAGTSASTPLANVQTFSYAWSPDGKKIVFVGARKDPANSANTLVGVFTINADLSGMTQLTSESFAGNTIRFPGPASFSPDGKSIIYNVTADNNIRVMNVDGTNPMVLPVVGDGPVFTRDGSKILFVNFTWDSAQSRYISQIESMNPDGNNVQAIVNPGFSVQDFYYDIAISPDGLQIAYDDSNVGPGKIYIANVDGSGATAIPGGGSQGIGW
jgi:Tol biopolymer transport system component